MNAIFDFNGFECSWHYSLDVYRLPCGEMNMLKVTLIILVICAIILIVYLISNSVKLLRQAEKQQAAEKRATIKQYQLHPKLNHKDQAYKEK